MRRLFPFMLLPLCCQSVLAAGLVVHVQGLSRAQGHLLVLVADSAAVWDGQAPRGAAQKLPVTSLAPMAVKFAQLPAGRYAVQVMHDANDNGKLDTNFVGMPTEAYGFSNNPSLMRKARFDEAAFDLPAAGTAITVTLN